jgi:hypothetical protein
MREELIRQLPFLGEVEKPVALSTREDCDVWVRSISAFHGEHHEVESAESLWQGHDVFSDLKEIWEGKHRG